MSDADEVIEAVSLFCNVSVRTITTFITVSYLWYSITPQSYWIGLLLCFLQIIVMQYIHPWYQQKSEATTAIKQKIEANINEYIQQHLSIILYSWQALYQQIHTTLRVEYINTFVQESIGYGIFLIGLQVIPALGDICIIYTLLQTNVSMIHFIEIYSYYQSMISATNACKDQWIQTWKKRPQLERTWNILQNPICKEWLQLIQLHSTSITFNTVTFCYPTALHPVFTNFSLHIPQGTHVFLKAPSGKGKTTLLKLLLGLYPIKSGSIQIGNRDVSTLTPPEIKHYISIVPQEPFYDASRTIRENIMMGSTESINVNTLLDKVKLSELQELIDKKPATLSGGQKQRIAIARIFVQKTPIIILDEPTSALDTETEQNIIDIVHEYSKDKTIIWITHNDILYTHSNIKRIYL
jgi:ABC-type branched-subunit amino acid transport system ATPase component